MNMKLLRIIYALKKFTNDYSQSSVYNMDETPAYYDMVPTRTIDMVGTKTVDLLNSGHEKTRFSLVITVRANWSYI